MAGNLWGEGPRGGIFGARVDPALLRELEKRAEAKRQMAQGLESAAAEQPIDTRPTFEKSLGGRILAAPSKLFGGLVVDPAIEGITDLLTLTGNVKRGEQPTMSADPQTGEMHTDPRLIERTANAAGTLAGSGLATAGGRAGVGVFGGRLAKTANLEKLEIAQKMAAEGVEPKRIWQETGWFEAPDKQWKFEISDEASRFVPPRNEGAPLGDVLVHPDLYAAYPELENIPTYLLPPGGSRHGTFSGSVREGDATLGYGGGRDYRSTLLHEGTHGVQDIEGFGRGSNQFGLSPNTPAWDIYQERLKAIRTPMTREEYVDNPYAGYPDVSYEQYLKEHKTGLRKNAQMLDRAAQETAVQQAYERSAGEVEARNVQKRRDMSAVEREVTPPWKTQDVPREQQIVRFGTGGGAQEKAERDRLRKGIKAYHGSPHMVESGMPDYRGSHTAPGRKDTAPLHDLTQIYPDDIYSSQAAQFYGHAGKGDPIDEETSRLLRRFRGKPDAEVTVYRAVPKDAPDTLNAGDWVTINRNYARGHGEGPMQGDYKIVSQKVRASDLFTDANSMHEFGYAPE